GVHSLPGAELVEAALRQAQGPGWAQRPGRAKGPGRAQGVWVTSATIGRWSLPEPSRASRISTRPTLQWSETKMWSMGAPRSAGIDVGQVPNAPAWAAAAASVHSPRREPAGERPSARSA